MSLLNKIVGRFTNYFEKLWLFYIRFSLGKKLELGALSKVRQSSRIQSFGTGTIKIGSYFYIGYNSELYVWNKHLIIGNNTSINDNCKIYGEVSIGSNCLFASNIFVSSGSHTYDHSPFLPIKAQDKLVGLNSQVIIEDDCWIGHGVVIMPGVYIGKGSIIGSNSVVTKNIYPYTICAGAPSKEIGKRIDFSNSFIGLSSSVPEHWPFFYRGIDYRQFELAETLPDGIAVVNDVSVYLLAREFCNGVTISGIANVSLQFEVYVNNLKSEIISVNKGEFNIEVYTILSHKHILDEFINLPANIKSNFNVVIIKTLEVNQSNAELFKVSSIILI
ncbi:DapH/DapD/GlmU-related protein [Sediminibacterium sp. C3]|uniref:acyltransferase n=1 Tax=Sediminibacterium sp. C3 TaxID=1267211 RepID=UPI00040913B8|nr:acyltransferase [Sediminibacterium sp. C3]